MTSLTRLTALCVGVLLLAAPAVWACGELGLMSSECDMPEMAGSMSGTSMCHDGGQMSDECCDVESAPEPLQAVPFESIELLTTLKAADLQVAASLAPDVLPPHSMPVDGFRLHDLGRFALFSSFLL